MRFDKINSFSVDDLLLDKGNYRFQRAVNQEDCISKIYESNTGFFVNLMESIAVDDMGEPILVYLDKDKNENIVLDGNRRIAAVKVLNDPSLSPTPNVKKKAEHLKSITTFNFSDIHAQVSEDKSLILKTVYERHAAGQGRGRLDWTALANAKFRFIEKISDGQDWYEIALLMELESREEDALEYVYDRSKKKGYSHEVFRRIVRSAISKGIIDKEIFSDRDQRLKQSKKKKINEALKLIKEFLAYMKAGKISLSRNGDTYADKKKIGDYLKQFEKTPEQPGSAPDSAGPSANSPDQNDGKSKDEDEKETDTRSGPSSTGPASPKDSDDKDQDKTGHSSTEGEAEEGAERLERKDVARIPESSNVSARLNKLNSYKLTNLYKSLTTIPLRQHPAICVIGAWAFFETLARNLGSNEGTSFDSYLGSKVNEWYSDRSDKSSIKQSLKFIADEGNCNKHCKIFVSLEATSLVNHFQVLDNLIVKCLDELIARKSSLE